MYFAYSIHAPRQADLLMTRAKYAWLWPDLIFRLSSLGREEQRNLVILHGFTRKVRGSQAEMCALILFYFELQVSKLRNTYIEVAHFFGFMIYIISTVMCKILSLS